MKTPLIGIVAKHDAIIIGAMADKIAKRRKALGITQVQLADAAGITSTCLACVERGDNPCSYTTLSRIASALVAWHMMRVKRRASEPYRKAKAMQRKDGAKCRSKSTTNYVPSKRTSITVAPKPRQLKKATKNLTTPSSTPTQQKSSRRPTKSAGN